MQKSRIVFKHLIRFQFSKAAEVFTCKCNCWKMVGPHGHGHTASEVNT